MRDDLATRIRSVAGELGDASGDQDGWSTLAHECIADLPPEDI